MIINCYMGFNDRAVLQNASHLTKVSASELIRHAVSLKMGRDFPKRKYPNTVISHGRRNPSIKPTPIEDLLEPFAGKDIDMSPVSVIELTAEQKKEQERVVLVNAFFSREQRSYLQDAAAFLRIEGRPGTVADIARSALAELFEHYGWRGWPGTEIARGKKTDFSLETIAAPAAVKPKRKPRPKPRPKP